MRCMVSRSLVAIFMVCLMVLPYESHSGYILRKNLGEQSQALSGMPPEGRGSFEEIMNMVGNLTAAFREGECDQITPDLTNNLIEQLDGFHEIDAFTKSYFKAILCYYCGVCNDDVDFLEQAQEYFEVITRNQDNRNIDAEKYYCAYYGIGLCYLQSFWIEREISYLQNAISSFIGTIQIIDNNGETEPRIIDIKSSCSILVGYSKIEGVLAASPSSAQTVQATLNETFDYLEPTGDDHRDFMVNYYEGFLSYLLASFNDNKIEKLSQLSDSYNKTDLLISTMRNKSIFDEEPVIRYNVEDMTKLGFAFSTLLRHSFGDEEVQDIDFIDGIDLHNSRESNWLSFNKELVKFFRGEDANPTDMNGACEEAIFWQSVVTLMRGFEGDVSHNRQSFDSARDNLDTFINGHEGHLLVDLAHFFRAETQLFGDILRGSITCGGLNYQFRGSTNNLPPYIQDIVQQRELLINVLHSDFLCEEINWSVSNHPLINPLKSGLNTILNPVETILDFQAFSPIQSLFLFGRFNPRFYRGLVNLLYYLSQRVPAGDTRHKVNILLAWAIFTENPGNWRTALDILPEDNDIEDEDIRAEANFVRALLYIQGGDVERGCSLLREINDQRARDVLTAQQCDLPTSPPREYNCIGFRVDEIDNTRYFAYGESRYNVCSQRSLRSISLQVWQNFSVHLTLWPEQPEQFIRFPVQESDGNWACQDYVSKPSILRYVKEMPIGADINITITFPEGWQGGRYKIEPDIQIDLEAISKRELPVTVTRFTSYTITVLINGYYPYKETMSFSNVSDVNLNEFMDRAERLSGAKEYKPDARGIDKQQVYGIDVESSGNDVAYISLAGEMFYLNFVSGSQISLGSLEFPSSIVADETGRWFVSDGRANEFFEIKDSDVSKIESVSLKNRLQNPMGLGYVDDRFYFANTTADMNIVSVEKDEWGDVLTDIHEGLSSPMGITIGGNNIFVSNWGNIPAGFDEEIFTQEVRMPTDIAVDDKGYVYICGLVDRKIYRFNKDGLLIDTYDVNDFPRGVVRVGDRLFVTAKGGLQQYDFQDNDSYNPEFYVR